MTTTEDPIIEVKHLAKQYRIGMDRTYKTFSESAVTALKSPVKALRNLTKRTETFWGLKDINFEVQRGEVVAKLLALHEKLEETRGMRMDRETRDGKGRGNAGTA